MTYRSQKSPRLAALALAALASGQRIDLAAAATPSRQATNFGTSDDSSSAHLQNAGTVFADHAGGAEYLAALTPDQSNTDIAGASNAKKVSGLGKKSGAFIQRDGYGVGAPAATKTNSEAGVVELGACSEGEMAAMSLLVAGAAKKAASGAALCRHWSPKKGPPRGFVAWQQGLVLAKLVPFGIRHSGEWSCGKGRTLSGVLPTSHQIPKSSTHINITSSHKHSRRKNARLNPYEIKLHRLSRRPFFV